MKRISCRAAPTLRPLARFATRTGFLHDAGAKLPIEGMLPCVEKWRLTDVPVVDIFAQIGAADGPSERINRSTLPAAIAVGRMPRLHHLQPRWRLERSERGHLVIERKRQLGPACLCPPEWI